MKQTGLWVLMALGATGLLAGCQTTTDGPSTYQGTSPDSRVYSKSEVARVRTALAAQYINERKLDAAQRQLEIAFEADSRYAPAYDMMGVLLQTEGSPANLAKADDYFKKAIAMDSEFIQAYNNYGVYLSLMGKHKEAVQYFTKAGATLGYEGRTKALENLGLTYKKLGDKANAKEAFIRAVEANTGSAIARIELIDIMLEDGNSLIAKRLYDELSDMSAGYDLPARVLYQGIRIAIAQSNRTQQQAIAQKLLSLYPLSDEAKKLKVWLQNPSRPLR